MTDSSTPEPTILLKAGTGELTRRPGHARTGKGPFLPNTLANTSLALFNPVRTNQCHCLIKLPRRFGDIDKWCHLKFGDIAFCIEYFGFMFGFDRKHDKINVEFVERGKEKPFAVSLVPIGQLPDTFEIATTLDISGKKWSVVDAVPKQKFDFEKSGNLRVILSQLQMVNPQDILFSLPTINDRMCALRKVKSLDGMLVIHEDDWRQVEFVSDKLLRDVEAEIKSIRVIYETKRKGVGFIGMHIRKLIEAPIEEGVISYSALKNHLDISKEYSGFGISGYMAIAEHGFAFETQNGLRFFGLLNQKDDVIFLCLANKEGLADKVGDIMKAFHLVGVDWCKCQIIRN